MGGTAGKSGQNRNLRFSVGIPAFNQGAYLEETILSLLNQTRPPDEIVISDHFSTDETPDVILKYAKHVRGVKPPVGSNVGGQWIYTLSCLSGDWVTLLSSDDVAYPNFCEVLMRGAARQPDAVLVRAAWQNIDAAGKKLSNEYLLSVDKVVRAPESLLEQKNGPKASFAAFAAHRETLEVSGGYPAAMESFGDWPMFMQLAPYGSIIYEHEIISGYRVFEHQDKFKQRLGMWLRDEERMFYEVMPLAAQRAKMKDVSWIERASRENFVRYLSVASERYPPSERTPIAPLFESWAARAGTEGLLQAFAAGEQVRERRSFKQQVKSKLRPLAQNMAFLLHKR